MRIRRSAAFAAPVLALTLFATACGGGGGEEDEGGNDTPTLADIANSDVNPQERDALQDGGTLNWAVSDFITQFNSYHTDGNLGVNLDILQALMPRAHNFDDTGAATPNTNYVEESSVSDDGSTVTFKLNPDAKWSNGEPITWEDYAATVETMSGRADGDFNMGTKAGYGDISKVEEGADEYEVVFTFDTPYAEWQGLFDVLYPAEYMEDPEKFNEGYLEDIPVTAGPFKLDEIDKTTQRVTVVRDDNWWGEPAKLDRITYATYESDAMAGVFVNDEIDAFYVGYDAPSYERAQEREDARIARAIDNGYRYIEMNAGRGPLADLDVRHAVMLGIDRSALAKASLEGVDWPSDPTVNRLIRSNQPSFQDNSGDLGQRDVERAAQLLDEAGWTQEAEGETRVNADGEKLSLTYVVPSGLQTTQSEAEITQQMLGEIGIEVKIESVPSTAFFTDYIYTGNFDMSSFVQVGTTPFAGESYENYGGPFNDDEEDWGNNNGRTSTPEINEKYAEMVRTTDLDRYYEIANEIDTLLWENGQGIPFFQRTGIWAVQEDLANFGANGMASVIYEDIGYMKE
ncbi:ABC transporter family substrate-binding protein [Marinactinospora thermotolerans]|uniref:Peptide/nickel transport system substrate-binding protein n=1 Tax=Marinactinospora thermotolerans DSM 45154 TaxID=1122192 RepID=A0A1T4RPH1_9ACTN|nr:ABC transporter family substrate-binding protein [Marinactinospora thermotolerans]SKA17879.1 peptide/nickel transport system substrate-binding protein [Marinactinospora thermotolerans DSM 45154]